MIKLALFLALLGVLDFGLGYLFRLYDYTRSGSIHKIHSVMTQAQPDLLIVGSSRAAHHYDPKVIEDSLGITVYNAGLDGRGLPHAYALTKGFEGRRYPRYILCEVTPNFDLYAEESLSLNEFYPYVGNPDVKALLIDKDSLDKYKMLSNAYRLNSALIRLVSGMFLNQGQFVDGYEPLLGNISRHDQEGAEARRLSGYTPPTKTIDSLKLKYLRLLIEDAQAHGSKIVFVMSPRCYGGNEQPYLPELEIALSYGVPVLDHLNDTILIYNPSFYQDTGHLNYKGASAYTKHLIPELRTLFAPDPLSQ